MKTRYYVVARDGSQSDPLPLREARATLREWDAAGLGPCKLVAGEISDSGRDYAAGYAYACGYHD